jgi:hypothetical protein
MNIEKGKPDETTATIVEPGSSQNNPDIKDKVECHSLADLEKQLDCLRAQLDANLGDLRTAEAEVEENNSQIKTLTSLIAMINQIVEDYVKNQPELKARHDELSRFAKEEKECLESVLKDLDVSKICINAQDVKNQIDVISEEINTLKSVAKPKDELDEATDLWSVTAICATEQERLEAAKKGFGAWLTPVRSIDARLKDLEQLRKEICKEHEAQNYTYAYYRLVCDDGFCERLCLKESPEVFDTKTCEDPPPAFGTDLREWIREKIKDSWETYSIAESRFNEVNAKAKMIESQLETKKAQLTEAEKAKEATIRRKMRELQTPITP